MILVISPNANAVITRFCHAPGISGVISPGLDATLFADAVGKIHDIQSHSLSDNRRKLRMKTGVASTIKLRRWSQKRTFGGASRRKRDSSFIPKSLDPQPGRPLDSSRRSQNHSNFKAIQTGPWVHPRQSRRLLQRINNKPYFKISLWLTNEYFVAFEK